MILVREYYWRKIEYSVDNEREDRRNTRDAYKKSTLEIIVGGEMGGKMEVGRISTRHYTMIESWKSPARPAIIQTKPLTRFPPISLRNDPRPSKKRSFPPPTPLETIYRE